MRICFVCHGNICRSPMAEYILKQRLRVLGKEKNFVVESRATSSEAVGNDIYQPIKEVMNKHNIIYNKHTATQLKASDYDYFDKFVCMDDNNMREINYIFENTDKVSKLSEHDVLDPWYTRNFEEAYEDISKGIDKFIKTIV